MLFGSTTDKLPYTYIYIFFILKELEERPLYLLLELLYVHLDLFSCDLINTTVYLEGLRVFQTVWFCTGKVYYSRAILFIFTQHGP